MTVTYQRIERLQTPSTLRVHFGPGAVRDGKVELWVSDSILKNLGAQRVTPEPASSLIDTYGILYTWPASAHPNSAAFELNPNSPGLSSFTLVLPATGREIHHKIFVLP